MRSLAKTPQLRGQFTAGDPLSGYYNDLRVVADGYGTPDEALGWIELLARRREHAWPVTLVQLGLGAWQHVQLGGDPRWRRVLASVSDWLVVDMDARGRLLHLQPMPHTYELDPPWASAMAQGQAASLLVRAAETLQRPELLAEAASAASSLLDDAPARDGAPGPLLVHTPEGPVLQEYPTTPPAHVLNGWMWALWGLYDMGELGDNRAADAFLAGVAALAARLHLYDTGNGWSRYDLYPHPMANVASPFYHRLHVEMLAAMHELAPRHGELATTAARWEQGLASRVTRATAVARKVGFRVVRPRRKAA